MINSWRVWAPEAAEVEVIANGVALRLERQDRGWWSSPERPPEGTEYLFSVDGGPARPDPRSAWQSQGVNGPSTLVDHRSFSWSDQQWVGFELSTSVLYELHLGTFSSEGTCDGAIAHLDHLVDLGVGAVEIMPVAAFAGERGWGYDGVDLFAPHRAYGGPDGLKRLVDACHRRGLGVFLDVVYNHLGPDGNYLGEFGPYFSDSYRTPWGSAVNLDANWAGGFRELILDNAEMWFAHYHLDGLRLDAVHALYDASALHILEELAERVSVLSSELERPLYLVAESDRNDPRLVQPRSSGGYGLAGCWCDDFHHALHSVLTGERSGYYEDFGSIAQLAKALRQGYVYDGCWSEHRKRDHGRFPTGVVASELVCFLQNHDQVGNRAQGERIGQLTSLRRAKVGAGLLLTAPFVPLLFQGEEWAASSPFQYFTDHHSELGKAVSEGRKGEFGAFGWSPEEVPDPQELLSFERSRLDWSELEVEPHCEMLSWYRQLIALRKQLGVASEAGEYVADAYDEAGRLRVDRRGFSVVANLGEQWLLERIDARILLSSDAAVEVVKQRIRLPPESLVVLSASHRLS